MDIHPLLILVIGIATVIGMIVVFKLNAFISLITAAMIVSLLAPGDWAGKIGRVATSFGGTAGGIGIVIALAAIIGKCMMDSGSADRVVLMFMRLLGQKRGHVALNASGYVLSVPVFFDTVFYLLVPLARSMYRQTKKNYLLYLVAIGAGGAITHTLVPPTPGPLVMADTLGVDLGMMILVGGLIAIPCSIAGMLFGKWIDRKMPIEMRELDGSGGGSGGGGGSQSEPEPMDEKAMPPLLLALAPVILPVILISISTGLNTWADSEHTPRFTAESVKDWGAFGTALSDDAKEATDDKPTPGSLVLARVPDDLKTALATPNPLTDAQRDAFVDALNKRVLVDRKFYKEDAFYMYKMGGSLKGLVNANIARMSVAKLERRNRMLIEIAFPQQVNEHKWDTQARKAAGFGSLIGNANLALLLSAAIAILVYVKQRKPTRQEFVHSIEAALMSGGVIILITAAGGAFGGMLQSAGIRESIQGMFESSSSSSEGAGPGGFALLFLAFILASVMKIAQGSGTVAMITGAAMIAGILPPTEQLGFHPVYIACAVGCGSLVCSWMNDSGFWIFAKMGGLTEVEALKSWTVALVVLGVVGMVFTCLFAAVLPLV